MLARARTLFIDGNSRGASWPLANIYQGDQFDLLDADANVDKRVAAYLLVSGLVLGEFCSETLKNVDWQSRYEAAQTKNGALKKSIGEQAHNQQADARDCRAQAASSRRCGYILVVQRYCSLTISLYKPSIKPYFESRNVLYSLKASAERRRRRERQRT